MERLTRYLALLAVLLAGALPAIGAPKLSGGPSGILMRDYTVSIDGTTADSPAFETVGACTFKLTKVGTGSVSVYAVATRSTATSSGTLIATLSTDGQRVPVTPPTRWARAVASGTGLDGSTLIVECPALSASGGGNVFNAADYGAVGDGSDATVAINAAVQAACASTGPRNVFIPAGSYRVGVTGSNQFYSGIRLDCDDLNLFGEGQRTKIYHGMDDGGAAIFACNGVTATAATCGTQLVNVSVSDLWIEDDDPLRHGRRVTEANYASLTGTGAPAFGDAVTWDAGASTGTIFTYEPTGGPTDRLVYLHVATGSLDAGDDITDGSWTLNDVSNVDAPTSEESHGIITRNSDGFQIRNVWMRSISDETIELQQGSQNAVLDHIDARECGQASAGGACISIGDNSSALLSNSYLHGGKGSVNPAQVPALLKVETNNTPSLGSPTLSISNVTIEEDGSTSEERVSHGFSLTANQGNIGPILFDNARIVLDATGRDAVSTTGGSYVADLLFTNSYVAGPVSCASGHNCRLVNSHLYTSDETGAAFQGIDQMIGGIVEDATNDAGATFIIAYDHAIVQGVTFDSADHCIQILGGDYATITGNQFLTCGGGLGILEQSGDFNYAAQNVVCAGCELRIGNNSALSGCENTGSGANSVCEEATTRELP